MNPAGLAIGFFVFLLQANSLKKSDGALNFRQPSSELAGLPVGVAESFASKLTRMLARTPGTE